MIKGLLALTVLATVAPCVGTAQSKEVLAGTWKLDSASETTENGTVNEEAYGHNPAGFLPYTADGRMSIIITNGGRKPLSANIWSAPAAERAEAYATVLAYAGRYTLA